MTTYVINRSGATLPVEIEFPNDPSRAKEFVFIQTKSKAILPSGSRVTPEYAAVNGKVLTVTTVDGLGEPAISDQ
jgi:hypothetical protein